MPGGGGSGPGDGSARLVRDFAAQAGEKRCVFPAGGGCRQITRSFLTLLGIILATTTLIVVMSLIHGMDAYIANKVSDMGSDGFRVVRIALLGNFDPKKYLLMQNRNPELSPDEFRYLKDHATLLSDFGMSANRTVSVSLGSQTLSNISFIGAKRHADANFLYPLRYGIRNHAVYSNCCQQQRKPRKRS